MKTINLNPSQYRVVRITVECSSAVPVPVPASVPVPITARASRMSQFQATAQATAKLTAPTTKTNTTNHPIYGIVNLALLAVSIYLLWANFL